MSKAVLITTRTLACAGMLGMVACTGSILDGVPGDNGGGGAGDRPGGGQSGSPGGPLAPTENPGNVLDSPACRTPSPGRAPLRRLSHSEYLNVVQDLFGTASSVRAVTAAFVPDNESLGFRNSADLLGVQSVAAGNYRDAAEALAVIAARDANLTRCATPGNQGACAERFIRDFGLRAYRRPLEADEVSRYQTMFQTALSSYDYATGVEWVVGAMLQSPHFLYRVEHGAPAASNASFTRPSPYEMATRLSFLLWQSMPDTELFTAAAQGRLETPEQIRAQAERLLGDAKAARVFDFFREWFDADTLSQWNRDAAVFPGLRQDLRTLFAQETDAFVRHLLIDNDGKFDELLAAPYTFVNADLARHYGLPADGLGAAFTRLDNANSAGFLTQSAFLTVHDKPYRTSIVLRGVKLRTDLMCDLVPAPPNEVELNLEAVGSGLSQRERLAMHRAEPACSGCHELIDPLGLVFESFDAVGRYRTVDELGDSIDTASEIRHSLDMDGPVAGPRALATRFAASDQVRQCYATQNFRFFYGRDYTDADLCSRAKLSKLFADSGYSLRHMLLALTQTDAFLYRPTVMP